MNTYLLTITFHSPSVGPLRATHRIEAFSLLLAQDAAARVVNDLSKSVSIPVTYTVRKSRKK